MTLLMQDLNRGDVLCTRADGWAPRLIRLGSALQGKPNIVNHVAVVHHKDAKGEWVCVEGRPGGVGWAPAAKYVSSAWTLSNAHQPKTEAQRQAVVDSCQALIGRPYDWGAIARDAAHALRIDLPDRWRGHWDAAQVVCSSLAAYVYQSVGLTRPPGAVRTITPGDWADFIIRNDFD